MATIRFPDLPNTNLIASLPISALNEIYSSLLLSTISANDPSTKTGIGTRGPVTRFHSKVPPPLPCRDYLARLTKFTPFPRDALLLSSIYLNRISHLALSTAYSHSQGDTFVDDILPPLNPHKTPQPLIRDFEPKRPQPVVVFSPMVLPTSSNGRSYSNGSLPSFSLSPDDHSSLAPISTSPPAPSSSLPIPSSPSLRKLRPAPLLNLFTLHRLILSTLLIATKYTVDGTLSQSRTAKVGGVSITELGRLEHEGLRLLGWEMYVGGEELEGVMKVWVGKGRELGLLPERTDEEEEEETKRENSNSNSENSPESPPRLEIPPTPSTLAATSPSSSVGSTVSQYLELPANSNSSSESSSEPSSTNSTSPSSPSIIFSPSDSAHTDAPTSNEGTPQAGVKSSHEGAEITSPSSPGDDSESHPNKAHGDVREEGGENTPTKALNRIELDETIASRGPQEVLVGGSH
ncbi:uncharacterized protein JCM6883_006853 [Sporobolomyces salmoneus]|uniref:uncharacterized protein n=1 Tax=Sporobolomyces salmoneus TaxID=183962 RepID=UPI00316BA532